MAPIRGVPIHDLEGKLKALFKVLAEVSLPSHPKKNDELDLRRKLLLRRLVGLELELKNLESSAELVLVITIICDGDVPLEDSEVGVREVEVSLSFVRCLPTKDSFTMLGQFHAISQGIDLDSGRARVFARGDSRAPVWIFRTKGSAPLNGAYSTDPPACGVKAQTKDWIVKGSALVYLRGLIFPGGSGDVNKKRMEDRLKALLLIGDRDFVEVTTANLTPASHV